ncbi:Lipase, putative [Hondaea fermentalgiana]|uniref:sn-1-specific diacylglycerol lipase n=1 Tax=Hondaea fermentalgiana TaxID=2315210 RepID=A0A2R5G5Q0_9STRA|nr:Lipase, putative [Hondaea fermentalgiana]|eukprot:GBG26382.1 Lipase, putative [Hondaea fermentalgiana]
MSDEEDVYEEDREQGSPVTTVFGDPLFLTRNTNLSRSESDMAADREALDELTGVDHTAEKQDVVTDLVAEDVDFDVADLEQFGPAEGDKEEEDDGGEVEDDDEDEDPKESNEDTSSDAALARAIAEAEADSDSDSFERPWAGFVPDDADEANELDAVFRRLSVALRGVRNNLDSQGDLVALQQSLQDWMTQVERSHDLADEEGDEACSLYRAKSEVEAETEGTNRQRTHLGFLRAANEVAREVEEDLVEAMLANAGYKLTIVGHSLGAAVATLLTIRWSSHPVLGSATCVGVASPCSTSRDFAESDVAKTKFNNIVLSDDVVPRLSLGSFMDLRDSLAYMARNGITERVMDIVGDGTGDPAELRSVLQPIYDEIVAVAHTNFKLYPPGNVWHIPRMAQSVDDARLVPVTDMGTIILSNEMFLSHLPNYYAHACIPESQESSTSAPEAT